MSFTNKKSKAAVDSAGEKWTKNLTATTKRRPIIPQVEKHLNVTLCKMPLNRDIVGRFLGLYDQVKGRAERINKISEELMMLWEKLSFPLISMQQVKAKTDKLIKMFEKYRKRNSEEFEISLSNVFDITKQCGEWLSSEDKELYRKQIESGGRVGYTTEKLADMSTIHPSKRIRSSSKPSTSQGEVHEHWIDHSSTSTSTDEEKNSTESDIAEKPNINYQFIEDVLEGYEELKQRYSGEEKMPECKNLGWRDDFRFLFKLCQAYKFYQQERKWPQLKWQKLPSLHNARWNSRAIFALIGFFLIPNWRPQLAVACNFIAGTWAKAWFSNQHYSQDIYHELHGAISKLNCPKALQSFSNHWVNQQSALDVPRSNIVAERAVKLMEEIHSTCKTDTYLNTKFLNSNSQL